MPLALKLMAHVDEILARVLCIPDQEADFEQQLFILDDTSTMYSLRAS